MNRKINRRMTYTPEFRADAVNRAIQNGHVPTVARELGINPSTLYNWKAASLLTPVTKPATTHEIAFRELAREEIENLEGAITEFESRRDALQRYLDA